MTAGALIEPLRRDAAFLEDVRGREPALRAGDGFSLWWLGQSGFLLGWRGRWLALDPYLSDSLTRKYADTGRPHVRMTARVVDPAALPFVDAVTASHAHTDHLDPDTLRALVAAAPGIELVAPEAHRALAAERSGLPAERILGVDAGTRVGAAGFSIAGVPAAHDEISHDDDGHVRHLGYVIGFGPWTIYHAGDTRLHDGLAAAVRTAAAPRGVDVALLPINGHDPARGVAGNTDGPEAARLAAAIGARVAVPCHYELFEFNTASPGAFVREAAAAGVESRVLRAGERLDSDQLP